MKYINWILIVLALIVLFVLMMTIRVRNANASVYPLTICHHTPANNVTHTFQNLQSYLGHLGTPHSGSTFDSVGACATATPTPTPTPTATPNDEECDKGYVLVDDECVPEETPTPSPQVEATATPSPQETTEVRSTTNAPVCTDGTPLILPSNVHVVRSGSDATVNFFTNSRNAHIFYKEVSANDWQHSVRDIVVTGGYVSYTIHDLVPELGYTFGVQAANGCAGGETVIAVVVDGPMNVTFPLTYWVWAR